MSILGIGPLLAIVAVVAAAAVITLERLTGAALTLSSPWSEWALFLGIVLLVPGVFFWLSGALLVKQAFESHRLTTSGAFGLCRNPMYAGFILFIIPGIALILNDLLLLAIPVAMCIAFKMRIRREEEFLAREFGEEYEQYRKSVPQLVPFKQLR